MKGLVIKYDLALRLNYVHIIYYKCSVRIFSMHVYTL